MNPKNHPNAYVTLSTGAVTAFVVAESKRRLGFDLTTEEAAYIVVGVIAAFHFAARYLGGGRSAR